jgi:hypothetical protein
MLRRPWLTGMAVLGWFGLADAAVPGTVGALARTGQPDWRLINVFGYFTVLTNTLVATVLSYAAFGHEGRGKRFFLSPSVSSAVAASIVLVALAYSVLLRHLWQPQGWQWLADELLHDVMPVLYALYWWREVPKGRLRLGTWHCGRCTRRFISAMRCGVGSEIGVYAYPFIDVASLGYGQVMLNALGVLAGFWGIGLVLLGLDRWRGCANLLACAVFAGEPAGGRSRR